MRTAERTLSGGRVVKLAMPDMYQIMTGIKSGRAPNPGVAAVLRLLEGVEALPGNSLAQRQTAQAEFYQGLYEVAALCLESPRLCLNETEAGPDDITPRDLSFNDLTLIYYTFFRTDPAPARTGPDPDALTAAIAGLYAGGASIDDVAALLQRVGA